MPIYRYLLLQRPPMPGSLPHGGLDRVETFYDKQYVCGSGHHAWGYAEYNRPLTDQEISDYELEPFPADKPVVPRSARPKIVRNRIRCAHCGDIIESESVHDFRTCSCGTVSVDGGHEYCKRSFVNGPDDYVDMSEYEFPHEES